MKNIHVVGKVSQKNADFFFFFFPSLNQTQQLGRQIECQTTESTSFGKKKVTIITFSVLFKKKIIESVLQQSPEEATLG